MPHTAPSPLPAGSSQQFFAALNHEILRQPTPLRLAISTACRMDEAAAVRQMLQAVERSPARDNATFALTQKLLASVRSQRRQGAGVDALMHEFSLSSQEGVALMCLAEALLRIPDSDTADRLIADKISKGNWQEHLETSASLFVNASAWGLLMTGKLVATSNADTLSAALGRLIAKGGAPLIRQAMHMAMRLLGNKFVTGRNIAEALENSRKNEARGYAYSYDMLGEAALTDADAARYFATYETAIHAIGKAAGGRGIRNGPGISVKLSALHPRYSRAQRALVLAELLPRLRHLALLAKDHDIGINIDAEEAERLELSLDLLEALAFDPALAGFDGIGFVVQAYQKRCPHVIDYLADLARRSGRKFMVRLVKGAYWDAEIKRAQVDGMPGYPVYTRKPYTDLSYQFCAQKLLKSADVLYPQFATHNAQTLAAIFTAASDYGVDAYEFQCLHGMGETLYDQVVGAKNLGRICRIYAPVGQHETLLAYLVRRLLENGANSSFVNQIIDDNIPLAVLAADPVAQAAALGGAPHPHIALPANLFVPARANSRGFDLNDEERLRELADAMTPLGDMTWHAAPLLASTAPAGAGAVALTNPADRRDVPGTVIDADAADIETALQAAAAFAPEWQATPAAARAAMLLRATGLLEIHRMELIALAMRKAGKSFANAIGEVREAVDFLRYYAHEISAGASAAAAPALGVVACISPWNFPLAIFTGQVGAALAAGNVVLAKPAEQTPLIAHRAVQLLHEAGIPRAALQLLPGRGETVGARLCKDARTAAVVFTGSTEVAQTIHRALAARICEEGQGREIPLIAETGGQNAMVVDSSALPEQVVQDVLTSAFDSAGQRCSALRVLCLQDEIADHTIAMLKGAMQKLHVGPTGSLAADIGPVIDMEAQNTLLTYIEQAKRTARDVYQLPLDARCAQGSFVAPVLLEIDSISQLQREVFGPVLHVLRYRRAQLGQLIDDLNDTGYGLTFGVHSRIEETIDFVTARVHAGNVYVNRNIVGAVVGVQPFGGEGKSGTGPKAGGPLYLWRLQQQAGHAGGRTALARTCGVLAEMATAAETGASTDSAAGSTAATNAALATLQAWYRQAGHAGLAERAASYQANALTGTCLRLPGPTGESNSLYFKPRGTLLCLAASTAALLNQIAAALASGNVAILAPVTANLLPAQMPGALQDMIRIAASAHAADPRQASIHGVLADAPATVQAQMALAARPGARLPLVTVDGQTDAPLWRLVIEQAVCINTTAAGGNASLMTMSA